MANFTIEFGELVETGFIPALTVYPIFDTAYRTHLNAAILDHYRFNEIGAETPARFNHFLKTRLNEIMPKYNKLYLSDLLTFNPLYNFNLTETLARENSGTQVGTAANSGTNVSTLEKGGDKITFIESDTPGGNIAIADVELGGYASKVTVNNEAANTDVNSNTGNSTAANSSEAASVESYLKNISGFSNANASDLLKKYRETLINIDLMVINELHDLFMGVYSWS